MIILLLVLTVLGVLLYFSLRKIVYDALDAGLLTRAKALATLIKNDQDEVEFDFSDDVLWEYSSPRSKNFFQIRGADGGTLERSASLGDFDLPWQAGEASPRFQTIYLKGRPVRVVSLTIEKDAEYEGEADRSANQGLIIQCAENIHGQVRLLHNFRNVLVLALLAIMLLSSAGGLIIAARALSPIARISATIDRISEANLDERLSVEKIPKELKVLAVSFNRTFDRLGKSFHRQRQFVADASHELKTPLSVIQSQSEITLRKERPAAEYRQALSVIQDTSMRMSDLVRKLLTIASFTAEKALLEMESLDAGRVIREAVKLLAPVAQHAGIQMQVSTPAGPVFVRGNMEALLEALLNVIDNAIKYNVPQGHVTVSLSKADGWVIATVKDSGIGIPADDLDRVFDRFYRVDRSRSRKIGGSGLGLSIAHEIIKLHGGRIEIGSEAGTGTTVALYLREAMWPA